MCAQPKAHSDSQVLVWLTDGHQFLPRLTSTKNRGTWFDGMFPNKICAWPAQYGGSFENFKQTMNKSLAYRKKNAMQKQGQVEVVGAWTNEQMVVVFRCKDNETKTKHAQLIEWTNEQVVHWSTNQWKDENIHPRSQWSNEPISQSIN